MAAPFFGRLALFVNAAATSAEEERDAPQTGQCDHGVNNSGQQRILSAEDPGYQIELENANQTPVDAADNGKNQG